MEHLVSKYYFVGSGIASMAGAAYLIHEGKVNGSEIVLFEEAGDFGGALDAQGDSTEGYFMSGSRMFEHKYNATFELFSFIPSTSNPDISVKQDTDAAERGAHWHNLSRLVDEQGKIVEFHSLGLANAIALTSSL